MAELQVAYLQVIALTGYKKGMWETTKFERRKIYAGKKFNESGRIRNMHQV